MHVSVEASVLGRQGKQFQCQQRNTMYKEIMVHTRRQDAKNIEALMVP